jgi:hypothetical protein
MVPALLFIIYILSQYALGMRYPGERAVLRAAFPLLALLFYALMSAWLLPDVFAGRILVDPQKQNPLAPGIPVPLQFSSGNVTQSLYLTINVIFAVAVAIFMTRRAISYKNIISAYLLGGYVVVGLTFWQFGSRVAGIPFPDDLLQSNPGWAIVEQAIGSVPRVQGPFSEPSALAGYMSGVALCCLWLSIRGYRIMQPNLLLALAIATTLLSTSTTGIITLIVGLPVTLAIASVGGVPGATGRIGKIVSLLLLAGLLMVGPIFLLKPGLVDSVGTVVEATVTKGQSDSYTARSASDAGAMATLDLTYGLGVGWGSYRSSSLIPGILANGGVFGMAMILWLVARVVHLKLHGRAAAPSHSGQVLVDGFSASLCCQLAAALVSAPMINSLLFFLQLGCIIGSLVRMTIEQRLPSAAAALPKRPKPNYTMSR